MLFFIFAFCYCFRNAGDIDIPSSRHYIFKNRAYTDVRVQLSTNLQGLKKHLLASKSIMLSIINEQMMSENIKGSLLEEVMSIKTFSEAYVSDKKSFESRCK